HGRPRRARAPRAAARADRGGPRRPHPGRHAGARFEPVERRNPRLRRAGRVHVRGRGRAPGGGRSAPRGVGRLRMATLAPTLGFGERLRDWREGFTLSERARRFIAIAGLFAFGGLWGAAVGVGGVPTLIVCMTFIACAFVLRDFRAGVVLLIAIMPVSQRYVFPHEMFGITGINPLNLVMLTTLTVLAMRTAGTGVLSHITPKPLLWLYLVPIIFGGLLGAPHAADIPAVFRDEEMIYFTNGIGYLRDMLMKPMLFVIYALLVSVAVQRSEKPERFITPVVISVWIMACVVLVFTAMAGVSLSDLAGEYSRQFFSALGMHANDLGRLYAVAYALLLFVWDRTTHIGVKTM